MSLFDKTFSGVRSVSVEVRDGDVLINAGSDPDQVQCTIDDWDESFRVDQLRDRLVIIGPPRNSSQGDVILTVPNGIELSVSSQSGDVVINADLGSTKITSGSGDVAVGDTGPLTIKTGSGDIAVGHASAAAELTSGSGEIAVRQASGPISAKTGSGDLEIARLVTANLSASSGSGDISVPSSSGSVDLRTASGSIDVGIADGLPAWLDLNTVTGDISIDLDPSQQPKEGEPYVTVRCRTASGEITVSRAE